MKLHDLEKITLETLNRPWRWTLPLVLLTLLTTRLPAQETNSVRPKRPDIEQDPGWQLFQRLAEAYGSPTNHQTTIQLHDGQAEADKGVPVAHFAIGMLRLGPVYTNGVAIPEDHAETARWLKKAADQGHPFAQALLARIYEQGDGVPLRPQSPESIPPSIWPCSKQKAALALFLWPLAAP